MGAVELDPVIHAPLRLQICAFLVPIEAAEFKVLREELEVSESVMSKHLGHLADAGYVKIKKEPFEGRTRTWASLTRAGRKAFSAHIKALKAIANF